MTVLGVAKSLVIVGIAVYALVCTALVLLQRTLIYQPDPRRVQPSTVGLAGVEEITLASPDGERLIAWFAPATAGRPTLLYLHGNGGSIAGRTDRITDLRRRGLGVLMLSYRGYGGSSGRPTEGHNVADALLAYDDLRRRGLTAADIVLFGESLGTGVATQVAIKRPHAALVLDSPYTSLVDVAARIYPFIPVRWLMLDRYETARHIRSVAGPVLVLHGEADQVVPVDMGRALFDIAAQRSLPGATTRATADIVTFPGAAHLDHRQFGSFDRLDDWLARLARQRRG